MLGWWFRLTDILLPQRPIALVQWASSLCFKTLCMKDPQYESVPLAKFQETVRTYSMVVFPTKLDGKLPNVSDIGARCGIFSDDQTHWAMLHDISS